MILELDVDGVVANIHCGLNSYVNEKFGIDFDGDKDIYTWGMKELDSEVRSYIFSLFGDPEFIRNLKPFNGSLEALKSISAKVNGLGGCIVFNTNVFKGCVEARKDWLSEFLADSGIEAFKIVKSNKGKDMLNSTIIVDDCFDNIVNSNAKVKVLMRRGHNRSINTCDIPNSHPNGKVYIIDKLEDLLPILDSIA